MSDERDYEHDDADGAAPPAEDAADAPTAPSPTKQPPARSEAGRSAYKPFSWR